MADDDGVFAAIADRAEVYLQTVSVAKPGAEPATDREREFFELGVALGIMATFDAHEAEG